MLYINVVIMHTPTHCCCMNARPVHYIVNLCVVPRVSDSHSNSRLLHFGDENNWNASMAVHGALAAFNPQEEDWLSIPKDSPFTLLPTGLLRMQRREVNIIIKWISWLRNYPYTYILVLCDTNQTLHIMIMLLWYHNNYISGIKY